MKLIAYLTIFGLLTAHSLYSDEYWENPWGKDAGLVHPVKQKPRGPCGPTPLAKIGDICIRFHQEVISPIDGPRSHFRPTSSQYTLDAMRKYGFFTGVAMGCDRLLRENKEEWVYPTVEVEGKAMKWDPVDGCAPTYPLPGKG